MDDTTATASTPEPDRQLIGDLVRFEYRSMVLRQLQVTVEWQLLEWLDLAACRNLGGASREICRGCPVRAQCLTAALVVGDRADWRGGVSRPERDELWQHLESTFHHLRDAEFMQNDRLVDGRGLG